MVGVTLADRYEIVDRVATGGMGTVYRATDTRLNRDVAIKILKEELADDPRFVERFRREARAVAALSHPKIASVFDYGEDSGRHFIVMELVQARDLARALREDGPMSSERAANVATQIAAALGHAHDAGLIHRDVKPANVMLGPDDAVKVTDFGIARAQADSALTSTGMVLGTMQYISPEQAAGEKLTPASDIYSLGIVLYEMVTGSVPFTGESQLAVAMRHLQEEVPDPRALSPTVTPELAAAISRATAKRPQDRWPDAAAFAAGLAGEVDPAPTPTAVLPAAQPTTEPLAGPTSVLAAGSRGGRVEENPWPFPHHPPRWDPRAIGRAVVAIFVVLLLLAAGLLIYRLATADQDGNRARRRADGGGGVATPAEPATFILEDVLGENYEGARSVLEEDGLVVVRRDQPSDAEPETVVGMLPEPGSEVSEGDTVTLSVSTGPPEESETTEDSGEEEDLPGDLGDEFTPPGQAKKDKEKDDD